MSVEVEYQAEVQRRAGENVMLVTRTAITVPESGRGREFSKSSREIQTQVIPLREVDMLMHALLQGFTYPVSDELNGHGTVAHNADEGDEPQYILTDTSGIPGEPMRFWTFVEARAHVDAMRKEGRITKGWAIWRGGCDVMNGDMPLETFQ